MAFNNHKRDQHEGLPLIPKLKRGRPVAITTSRPSTYNSTKYLKRKQKLENIFCNNYNMKQIGEGYYDRGEGDSRIRPINGSA